MADKSTARILLLQTLYYQSANSEPISAEGRYTKLLQTDEQPYQRRMKVTDEWKPLDAGWVESASYYCVENLEGKYIQTIPTLEQRSEDAKRIIELGIASPIGVLRFASLSPGEFMAVPYKDVRNVRIRCLHESAKVNITVYPE